MFLRNVRAGFGSLPYFLDALGGYSHGLGIVNCNQAKTSKEEILPAPLHSLGLGPEILMELRCFFFFSHSAVNFWCLPNLLVTLFKGH